VNATGSFALAFIFAIEERLSPGALFLGAGCSAAPYSSFTETLALLEQERRARRGERFNPRLLVAGLTGLVAGRLLSPEPPALSRPGGPFGRRPKCSHGWSSEREGGFSAHEHRVGGVPAGGGYARAHEPAAEEAPTATQQQRNRGRRRQWGRRATR
jgi:hypothetical protein